MSYLFLRITEAFFNMKFNIFFVCNLRNIRIPEQIRNNPRDGDNIPVYSDPVCMLSSPTLLAMRVLVAVCVMLVSYRTKRHGCPVDNVSICITLVDNMTVLRLIL